MILTGDLCPEQLVSGQNIQHTQARLNKLSSNNLTFNLVSLFSAYTQVASLTVYSYLFTSLFANQYLEPRGDALDNVTFSRLNVSFSLETHFINHTPGKGTFKNSRFSFYSCVGLWLVFPNE